MLEKIKFLFVGAFNTFFGFSIYTLLLVFGLHYEKAVVLATSVGAVFNYVSYSKGVFKKPLAWAKCVKFLFLYLFVMLVQICVIGFYVFYGLSEVLAGLLALPIVVVLSYLGQKFWIFEYEKKIN